jgi:PAS domain S-box-containing protein
MKEKEKTKKQLLDELADMHKKVNELETSVIEHEQGESAARNEELFKTVIENALEFITIIDGDGIVRYESPSAEVRSGYKPEDIIGKRIFDIIHPDDLPKAIDIFNRTIQNPDKTQSGEVCFRDNYGRWRILEAKVRNLLNNPIVKGIVINSYDITEKRQAETQLRESENLYRTLTEYSLTGIYLFRERRYLFANEMYSKISGYSWDDLKSMDPVDLIAPEYRKQLSERVKKRLAGEDVPSDYETQILRKDGAVRDVHIKATRVKYEGEPTVLGNIIDITERKRSEEALKVRSEELARSNRDLEQFAYVASHDLQEPLRMVTSYVQLLARRYIGKLDSDADDFIRFAVDGAIRMWKLINDLLTYSRVGTRGKELEPTDCEMVLNQSLSNLKVAIEDNGAVVTHDPLPTVTGDNPELVELFQNLIGNAIKFRGDEPPRVHVSASRNGNEWTFSVRDNGIGIAPEYAERIFVIFQRLHSREEYPGTGIGLAISQKIVERHGGRIWMESEPEKGTTFYFTLPKEGVQQTRPLEQ